MRKKIPYLIGTACLLLFLAACGGNAGSGVNTHTYTLNSQILKGVTVIVTVTQKDGNNPVVTATVTPSNCNITVTPTGGVTQAETFGAYEAKAIIKCPSGQIGVTMVVNKDGSAYPEGGPLREALCPCNPV